MKKTFLYRVYTHSKMLFFLLAAFIVLTLCTNLRGFEVTPFFVWGMYSEKEQPVQQYTILQTTINDNVVVNPYDYATTDTRLFLMAPLTYYKRMQENKGIDPTVSFLQNKLGPAYEEGIKDWQKWAFNTATQQKEFLNWYGRYLIQVTKLPVKKLRIDVVHAHYTAQQLVTDSTNLFAVWEKP